MNNTLSIYRLILLLKNYKVIHVQSWVITTLIIFGTLLILTTLISKSNYINILYSKLFHWGLIVCGSLIASYSFKGMQNDTQKSAFLLIPASAFEKTLAPLIISFIIFPLFFTLSMVLGTFFIEAFTFLVSKKVAFFNPLNEPLANIIPQWLVFQSAYFLGATWFSKHNLLKTSFTLCILIIGFMFFTRFAINILIPSIHSGIGFQSFTHLLTDNHAIYYSGTILLTITCWSLAWLRIKEADVNHGI